jgi:hypothetical protein
VPCAYAPCKTCPCPIHSTLHIFWLLHHRHVFFSQTQIYHYCLHHRSFVVDINLGFWYQNELMPMLENLYLFTPIVLYAASCGPKKLLSLHSHYFICSFFLFHFSFRNTTILCMNSLKNLYHVLFSSS